ncbi:MAG: GAF domain-containing protein [Acidobacteria bacterium]|nr:GAF domain-containing protein [Acidobacteriota bacterium]
MIQAGAWIAAGGVPRRPAALVQIVAAWIVMLILATMAARRIGTLSARLSQNERAHLATLSEVEQLQTQNAILEIVARSVDVTLAFQALALRIARIVPCDRVGLALLGENGQDFQTYTARVREDERRVRPRAEVVFKIDGTAIGAVVRSREPLVVTDTTEAAADFLDVNVLRTAGFQSALLMPLVSKGRAVGTLNVVSRQPDAFTRQQVDALQPIAEIFAVACVAQQLQMTLGKYRTMEAMSEVTLSIATEINSALQTIIGHCDLLEREYPDPNLQRDLATVVRQAQRISELLEKMRASAHERLKEAASTINEGGIPSSPEAFGDRQAVS